MHKKILLVMSKFPPEYSGPGVRIPRLYDWFEKKGYHYDVQIVCNGIEKLENKNFTYKGYPVQRITAEYLNKLFLFFKFVPKKLSQFIIYQYEFIKTFLCLFLSNKYKNIDLLHVAGHSGGTAAALLWANIKKIPVLMELVNSDADIYQKYLLFFKVSIPNNGIAATLTKATKNRLEEDGFDSNQIWFKPNPIDIQKYNLQKNIDNAMNLKISFEHKNIILSIAKIIPRKNQIFLLDVLKLLPNYIGLILAGPKVDGGLNSERDNLYIEEIKNKITTYGLTNRVMFVEGHVDTAEYMKICDVYLMPAWGEGFGTPMVEAMACGAPVIANADEIAFKEWVKNGENGFLANVLDSQDWANKILEALEFDIDQKNKISMNISTLVSQERIFSDYERVFNSLL